MGRAILLVLAAASIFIASGCRTSAEQTAQRSDGTVTTVEISAATTQISVDSASTVENDGAFADALETAETAEVSTSTVAAATTAADSTQETTPSENGALQQPGDSGAFTSPSGNIACVMNSFVGASCWIGEKEWTIPQPSDPDCVDSDYGNAVDVTDDGIHWPCYTDFYWDASADALPYGDSMQVGTITCSSARNGVSCRNTDGQGFRVARAAVVVF